MPRRGRAPGHRKRPRRTENSQGTSEALLLLPGASDAPGSVVRRLYQMELVGLACFVVVAGIFVAVAIVFFHRIPLFVLLRDWCMDDTFYYLQVARNVAAGRGVTFDGVNPTNGFHWLWMLMCVPVHWLASWPEGTTRLMKVLEVLAGVGTLASVLWLTRLTRSFWLLALPTFFGLMTSRILFCGMEASVSVMSLMLCAPAAVWALGGNRPPTRLRMVMLGLVCTLPGLARMENFAFVLMLTALLAAWGLCKVPGFNRRTAIWLAGPVLAGTVVYFAANWLAFGTPWPISGMVKQWWASRAPAGSVGLSAGPANFAKLASLYLPRQGLIYGGVGLAVLAASWAVPTYRRQGDRRQHLLDVFCLCAVLLHVVKLTAYSIRSTPQLTFYTWYHVTALVVKWFVLFYLPTRVLYVVRHVRFGAPPTARWKPAASCAVVYALAAVLLLPQYNDAARTVDQCRQLAGFPGADWEIASCLGAQWINQNLPPDATIGAWDSGVLGYFCQARVINLDGLINSRHYLECLKSGRFEQFLADNHVQYLANVFPYDLTDAAERFRRSGNLPAPLEGKVSLVYKEEQARISMEGKCIGSFRVYLYEPPSPGRLAGSEHRATPGAQPERSAPERPEP